MSKVSKFLSKVDPTYTMQPSRSSQATQITEMVDPDKLLIMSLKSATFWDIVKQNESEIIQVSIYGIPIMKFNKNGDLVEFSENSIQSVSEEIRRRIKK